MGGGGKGGGQTVEQKADPWEGQQPYLQGGYVGGYERQIPQYDADGNVTGYVKEQVGGTNVPGLFPEAARLYGSGALSPEYYPGSTLAGMSDATSQAIALQQQRALAGNSAMTAGQGQLESTLAGDYLNNNPFMNATGNPELDAMVQRAIGQTNAGVTSNFATAGRYGSGAHAAAANDAAGNIASQMYGAAYDSDQNRALSAWQSERQNQLSSASLAPQYAANDYADLAALSEAGTALENYDQEAINAAIDRYNYDSSRDATALQNYANLINGNYGMSGTSTTSAGKSNPLGSVASGALTGAAIGSAVPVVGTGVGAIGGGLLGLLGSGLF